MSHVLFEIPSVICILLFVGFVVFRAFTSPLPGEEERFDLFMKRHDISRSRTISSNAVTQRENVRRLQRPRRQ